MKFDTRRVNEKWANRQLVVPHFKALTKSWKN